MPNVIMTPNMNLPNSVPGQDPGPDYANNQFQCNNITDAHNHAPGNGVQIPPAGLNINSDLTFNGNSATNVKAVVYAPQGTFSTILSGYFKADGNFYINDGAGNTIQITSGGSVNATSSGISSGTATASFVSGVLVVNAASNTPANIQIGSVLLGNNVSGSKFLTLSPPSAMPANLNIVLPTPQTEGYSGVPNFLTMDNSGNMQDSYFLDNSTLNVNGNIVRVAPGGITTTQINSSAGILGSQLSASANINGSQLSSSAGIGGGQIANTTITQANLALKTASGPNSSAGNLAISATSGTWTVTSSGSFSTVVTNTSSLTSAQTSVTITAASPAVVGVTATGALYINQPVVFSGGTYPTGVVAGTTYFISNIINGSSFNISATVNGASINTTGSTGSGITATFNIMSVALVTLGSPIKLKFIPDGTSNGASLVCTASTGTGTSAQADFSIFRNGSLISKSSLYATQTSGTADQNICMGSPPGAMEFIDVVAAGNYSYTAQITAITNSGASAIANSTTKVLNCKLVAYEM